MIEHSPVAGSGLAFSPHVAPTANSCSGPAVASSHYSALQPVHTSVPPLPGVQQTIQRLVSGLQPLPGLFVISNTSQSFSLELWFLTLFQGQPQELVPILCVPGIFIF